MIFEINFSISKICNGKGRVGNKTTSGRGNKGSSLTAVEKDVILGGK